MRPADPSQQQRELSPWRDDLEVVGRAHPRIEAAEKVTGAARYACDIRLPGQLYAAVLRCPHPHAELRTIVTDEAAKLPGVHAVLSAVDAPDIAWHRGKLFDSHLRFVGDEVAAVAAESPEVAEDALRLIEVEYRPLPFVVEPEDALAAGAPQIHAGGNRAGEPRRYSRGDVSSGLNDADVVIDRTYTTQTVLHNSLEPHGCTAHWTGEHLTVWESTQGVYATRNALASKLGMPAHRIRVITEHMGGGFGSKLTLWKHTVIAALLARRSGRPVQLVLDREAENLAAGNRNATRQHVRLGARRDGTLTALAVEVLSAVGAEAVGGESSEVVGPYQRLYLCPNVSTEQIDVYVNAGPASPFRAPGYVEGSFGLESAIDELAAELQMDPLKLRLRNYAEIDQKLEQPYSLPDALQRCYERADEAFDWGKRSKVSTAAGKRRGVGVAAQIWAGGGWPPAYAWAKLNHDGSLEVVTGAQDIGTGSRTALAQIAAEELGLPLECVTVRLGDTGVGPYGPMSGGSGTLASVGPAVRGAAADIKVKLLQAASRMSDLGPAQALEIRDGTVGKRGSASKRVPLADIAARLHPQMLLGCGERGPNPTNRSVRTFGVQCVEIEVDTELGEIRVQRIVAAHDCGRIVNPTLVESQIAGGVTQGLGFALMEERVIDPNLGLVLNADLENYLIPTARDVPAITHAEIDRPDIEANSIGAKGIGEPPIIPTAAALANALYDAVGVRLRDTPLTRRKLLSHLSQSRSDE
jgi:CO/xanthine dehydrogenase Mo-binding subunit